MESQPNDLRPRLYTLMVDTRLDEFPYVQFHIPATEGRSGWLDSSEIYADDLQTLHDFKIILGSHVTLYDGVRLYHNTAVESGVILNAGCIICPGVELQDGAYVDANQVISLNPPSRWTKLIRTAGYYLGRFKRFTGLKPRTDQSIGS